MKTEPMMKTNRTLALGAILGLAFGALAADWHKPYRPPCAERENVFEFAEKPSVKLVGKDRYEIAFAVKGLCDVTVGVIDGDGNVVRHLASGVLGANAPEPFQKSSLSQKIFWNGKDDLDVFSGTYTKTRPSGVQFLLAKAAVPMEPVPARPSDLIQMERPDGISGFPVWMEGAEWFYAGASPIVHTHCRCPTMRVQLDWYKRSFVPEAYRHSYAVLDTNGNLVMHIGRYGNFDSINGPNSKIPIGDDNIAMFQPRFMGATDSHLVYPDSGESPTVLKIGYHREETVSVR